MTPEAYIAAVKACPRVAWIENTNQLVRGYVIHRNGERITAISDLALTERKLIRWYAKESKDVLFPRCLDKGGKWSLEEEFFFGEIPPDTQLRAYFIAKHGYPQGLLDQLFPKRILKIAAAEWVGEQIKKQCAQKEAQYEVACLQREAQRKAEHEAQMRKRSYWTFLDGYAFERATAEVLRKHQFTAMVTRGSGDGGVDIEVTRNGLKGVVQCKAHINCAGPSVEFESPCLQTLKEAKSNKLVTFSDALAGA
jgi:Restriction endonuclease